ncbi:DsrE family protein [Desulfospira joergensenii]|uniref:DsrE family protein n=1 Tax=Desulfospira joergensenii TaxID=53329 RepID=UPI0003B71095|nr:DsrE family protein [Desulfospira joergensenii]
MSEKIIYFCTHGGEGAEKASICFAMANAGVAMDIDITVALQGNGVYLAQKGFIDHVPATGGFAPLTKLMGDFMELGGKILVCKPCIDERKIQETDLIEGAQITAGGTLNVLALEADAQLVY